MQTYLIAVRYDGDRHTTLYEAKGANLSDAVARLYQYFRSEGMVDLPGWRFSHELNGETGHLVCAINEEQ